MKFARPAPALLTLAALLAGGLVGCRPEGNGEGGLADDLPAQILFTANGTYDARADRRERTPGRDGSLRRITWTTRPPLPARAVIVRFDGNVRSLSWEMRVDGPTFELSALAGEDAASVTTPQGEGLRPRGGRLADVLILRTPGGLRLLTRGYAVREEPALLAAFRRGE
ncbi:hypothetical protein V3W47_15545 [Deinococcus sp. YIM 134068]|uniref:hypothetical protein n=1 Tax=Deinococcus lichenicola TaxID=3118910 RepID=UPI002F949FC1